MSPPTTTGGKDEPNMQIIQTNPANPATGGKDEPNIQIIQTNPANPATGGKDEPNINTNKSGQSGYFVL